MWAPDPPGRRADEGTHSGRWTVVPRTGAQPRIALARPWPTHMARLTARIRPRPDSRQAASGGRRRGGGSPSSWVIRAGPAPSNPAPAAGATRGGGGPQRPGQGGPTDPPDGGP